MEYEVIDRSNIGYLEKVLINQDESLKVLSYDYFKGIDPNHIKQFCVEQGIYCLPTKELIDFLQEEMGTYKTIEIGAGHGAIGRELGIISTDSMMQLDPTINEIYRAMNQAPAKYGHNVLAFDAEKAIRKFHPECVIAAWVTHKYDPMQHYREGNMYGVKEQWILNRVNKYIFVGNTHTHRMKPILNQPHTTIEADWLVSRVYKKPGYKDIIWIWEPNNAQ